MAVQLTRKFWLNVILFIVACVALGISIWAFTKDCKKDNFGSLYPPIIYKNCEPSESTISSGPYCTDQNKTLVTLTTKDGREVVTQACCTPDS
tara:strand:+ start:380 stop:658 length:279 start_codon:yes stop_codon:yes gene_type:complete